MSMFIRQPPDIPMAYFTNARVTRTSTPLLYRYPRRLFPGILTDGQGTSPAMVIGQP